MVECLLVDVPGGLLAINPRLAVAEDAILTLVSDGAVLALVILDELLAIDAILLPVADELLSFTEGLGKIGQALFAGEFTLA